MNNKKNDYKSSFKSTTSLTSDEEEIKSKTPKS
jgi:hypothetical protein